MADRALIIAIENYGAATSGFAAKQLPGTVDAATRFRDWLEAKWTREQTTGKVFFCSEPQVPGGRGASNAELIQALIDLQAEGQNTTDSLFVYFSGHGFQTRGETISIADVIVTSDYVDLQRSAHCCWKLSALIQTLRCLGHGRHFYFVDACRNEVPQAIASSIMPTPCDAGVEEPAVYVVQSTVPGAPALVAGPFAQTLRNGLNGAGIAARWQPPITDSMRVQFDSLMEYLREQLDQTQPVRPTVEGPVRFTELLNIIKPPPTYELTVTLAPAPPMVNGQLLLTPHLGQVESRPLTTARVVLPLKPNGYTVAVVVDGWTVGPREHALNLYSNDVRTFNLTPVGAGPTEPAPPPGGAPSGRLRVSVPTESAVDIHHINLGTESSFPRSGEAIVPAGTYSVRLRNKAGNVVRRSTIVVGSADTTDLAPADWAGSLPHQSLASMLPHTGSAVDFSEELRGPVADPDLGVWLAIVGAGRALGSQGDYSKIGPLPLATFAGELPGASPLYVLAGLDTSAIPLRVAIHSGETPLAWLDGVEPVGMPGLREVVAHPAGGQRFVTIVVGDQPALTVASFASPNRCTLITLVFDELRQPRIAQYLVPLGHLMAFLDPDVRQKIDERRQWMNIGPLMDVQSLATMHRAFRRRRDLEEELGQGVFLDLLYGKWVDPIGASLATYECVRRNQRQPLPIVAANMDHYFRDLPDTAAIMALAGTPVPPRGVPLFQDGLRLLQKEVALPFPIGLLDFTSPWTSWRGAVSL